MANQVSSPNWWQQINRWIATSRLGAWFLSHAFPHIDRLVFKITGSRTSLSTYLTGLPIVNVTIVGAKSGKVRSVPLIGFPYEDKIVLIASNWGYERNPSWYFNLRAHPEAEIKRDGRAKKYKAHEALDTEYDDYWRRAVQMYPGYEVYKKRARGRTIPIIVLTPQEILQAIY